MGSDGHGKVPEVLITAAYASNVGADGPISRFEETHGLARLHSHRHQARVVLEQRQTVWIVVHTWRHVWTLV